MQPDVVLAFAPAYGVSADGTVWTRHNNRHGFSSSWRKLKPWLSGTGYLMVSIQLYGSGIKWCVHRLVAETFVYGRSDTNIVVNHLDGNKKNNNASNLEWTTYKGNAIHAKEHGLLSKPKTTKLSPAQVMELRASKGIPGELTRLAKQFGISMSTASLAANGITHQEVA